MKQLTRLIFLLTLVAFIFPPPAFAKGPADKITISGPGLNEPIEITDPEILAAFSPWGEDYFDKEEGALKAPPEVRDSYLVQFYLRDGIGELHLRYTFQYVPGQLGYIYLPGKGDAGYETNMGTIIRYYLYGKWFYASQAWNEAMRPLLEAKVKIGGSEDVYPPAGESGDRVFLTGLALRSKCLGILPPRLW